jgi:hypothetical protein
MSQFKRNIKKQSTPTSPQNWRITFELRNHWGCVGSQGEDKKGMPMFEGFEGHCPICLAATSIRNTAGCFQLWFQPHSIV